MTLPDADSISNHRSPSPVTLSLTPYVIVNTTPHTGRLHQRLPPSTGGPPVIASSSDAMPSGHHQWSRHTFGICWMDRLLLLLLPRVWGAEWILVAVCCVVVFTMPNACGFMHAVHQAGPPSAVFVCFILWQSPTQFRQRSCEWQARQQRSSADFSPARRLCCILFGLRLVGSTTIHGVFDA